MSVSPSRIALMTLGLVGIGAACGALLGGLTLVVAVSPSRPGQWAVLPLVRRLRLEAAALFFFFRFGAAIGACLGSVLAPTVGWIFLRRVPLYRAVGQTALGALLGIAIAAAVQPRWSQLYAVAGFLAAAVQLWVSARQRARVAA